MEWRLRGSSCRSSKRVSHGSIPSGLATAVESGVGLAVGMESGVGLAVAVNLDVRLAAAVESGTRGIPEDKADKIKTPGEEVGIGG